MAPAGRPSSRPRKNAPQCRSSRSSCRGEPPRRRRSLRRPERRRRRRRPRSSLPQVLQSRAQRLAPRRFAHFAASRSLGHALYNLRRIGRLSCQASRQRLVGAALGDQVGDVLAAFRHLVGDFASTRRSTSERIFSVMSSAVRPCPSACGSPLGSAGRWVHEVCHWPRESPSRTSAASAAEPILDRVIETGAPASSASGRQRRGGTRCAPGAATGRPHAPRPRAIRLRQGAFVDDLLALAFCKDADPARRPCNACRGCRDARARAHPDLVIGSPEPGVRSADGGEHRRGRPSLAARRGRCADRRRASRRPHRARRPRQRADPERPPEGARGADRPPHLHPRRR